MDSGYYAACTAVKAQSQALEIAANNIANVNTSGYRGQIPSLESLLVASRGMAPDAWSGVNLNALHAPSSYASERPLKSAYSARNFVAILLNELSSGLQEVQGIAGGH